MATERVLADRFSTGSFSYDSDRTAEIERSIEKVDLKKLSSDLKRIVTGDGRIVIRIERPAADRRAMGRNSGNS